MEVERTGEEEDGARRNGETNLEARHSRMFFNPDRPTGDNSVVFGLYSTYQLHSTV